MSTWYKDETSDPKQRDGNQQKKRMLPPRPQKKQQKQFRDDEFNWNKVSRVIASWLGILLAVFLVMYAFKSNEETEYEVNFTTFQQLLNESKISEALIKKSNLNDYDFHGKLTQPMELTTVSGKRVKNATRIVLTLPYSNIDDKIIADWTSKGIRFNIIKEDSAWFNMLIGFLPWVLLIGIWLIIFRRMQSGAGGPKGLFSFGKSRAKLLTEGGTKVTFEDVAGADEAKIELQEIIEFLKDPGKFQRLGGKIPRGVLLLGPPGTGKTLLARAVAGEAGVPFFSISGADFVEMFVGVGASRVRDLFEQGKKNAPCIIFIDEIDAVGRHRGAGLGGGHDEREQTLNQLLVEMDGFEQNSGVIIIAATNRPDVLDPALLRPGRFDRQVVVDRPDVKGREGIFRVHTKNIPLGDDVVIETLAKGTPGLSGADIANLVNEAALLAARENEKEVSMRHFEAAKDKVMMGMERKSLIITDREKKITAYHEAGHVLVAKFMPDADPVHKVTIIPRGRALGVTTYLPIDEKHTYSKNYLEAMITYALGGRAAEKIIFNQLTTGAGNDIERATELARKMVCEWGMSEKLGPLAYGAKEEELFLGREITRSRNFSEQTAIAIDEEVKKIVTSAMKRAEKILRENLTTLHRLANALLEREILDSEEIDKIMRGEELPPVERRKNGQPEQRATDQTQAPAANTAAAESTLAKPKK
ncbi:MAG TPA: ATP-dependent zinc metalloprotease FtsH [Bacteroidota bacterium]|nr:ATP-dependent zinc metalloprotease FtsH [Bacteroidota bacterium]